MCTTSQEFGECLCLPLLDLCFGALIPPASYSVRSAMRERYRIQVHDVLSCTMARLQLQIHMHPKSNMPKNSTELYAFWIVGLMLSAVDLSPTRAQCVMTVAWCPAVESAHGVRWPESWSSADSPRCLWTRRWTWPTKHQRTHRWWIRPTSSLLWIRATSHCSLITLLCTPSLPSQLTLMVQDCIRLYKLHIIYRIL